MKFLIVSGMSGAGKSKAASILEDFGFYCVDNMPVALIPNFAEICMANQGKYEKVALVTDVRGGETFDKLFESLGKLEQMGCPYEILFVEASPETIIHRYKETRRMHPLGNGFTTIDRNLVVDAISKSVCAPTYWVNTRVSSISTMVPAAAARRIPSGPARWCGILSALPDGTVFPAAS